MVLSGHSRRALVAATAALAAGPAAEAKNKRKKGKNKNKRKKKPVPAPLVYAVVTDTEWQSNDLSKILLRCRITSQLPGTGAGSFVLDAEVAFATAEPEFVAKVQDATASFLSEQGVSVPADRIAVTLL